MIGIQCKGCRLYKKRLLSIFYKGWNKGKCTRVSPLDGLKGICWMHPREMEY